MARSLSDKLAQSKVGSIFFKPEEDESVSDDKTGTAPEPSVNQATAPQAFRSQAGAPTALRPDYSLPVSKSADPETLAKIQSIADRTEQVSFTKFMELVKSMRPVSPDEASCYRTAFAAAKAFNLPVSEVLRGVDAILGELSQAENKFKSAAPQRIQMKVSARRERIAKIQQTISAKQQEAARIQEALRVLGEDISRLSQEQQSENSAISQDEQSVREDVEKFSTALETVRAPYMAERQKIELYGKGV